MTRRIHIFVSGKGGVGKTALVYCLYQILLNEKLRPAILDLNPTNHDIYNILTTNKDLKPITLSDTTFDPDDKSSYLRVAQPAWRLYRREHAYNMLGFALDIWLHISRVSRDLRDDNAHLLVDTNLHPLNLYHKGPLPLDGEHRNAIKQMVSNLNGNGNGAEIFIWFIWSGMPLELYARGIGDLANDLNSQLDLPLYLMHVFNPSAFVPEGTRPERVPFFEAWLTMLGLPQSPREDPDVMPFAPFKHLYDLPPSKHYISNVDFHNLVSTSYSNHLLTFYTNLGETVGRLKAVPWNIIALPNYYPLLHGYIDRVGPAGTVGGQENQIEKLMKNLMSDLQHSLGKPNRRINIF